MEPMGIDALVLNPELLASVLRLSLQASLIAEALCLWLPAASVSKDLN